MTAGLAEACCACSNPAPPRSDRPSAPTLRRCCLPPLRMPLPTSGSVWRAAWCPRTPSAPCCSICGTAMRRGCSQSGGCVGGKMGGWLGGWLEATAEGALGNACKAQPLLTTPAAVPSLLACTRKLAARQQNCVLTPHCARPLVRCLLQGGACSGGAGSTACSKGRCYPSLPACQHAGVSQGPQGCGACEAGGLEVAAPHCLLDCGRSRCHTLARLQFPLQCAHAAGA